MIHVGKHVFCATKCYRGWLLKQDQADHAIITTCREAGREAGRCCYCNSSLTAEPAKPENL